ncbi:hypothetical protein DFQ28_009816 [Apophysomyces sp. BC1034]|nr:hypothetical protein DFQ30_009524 [Apophysomyces sp. BC1015]KAG0181601.1 hypothetical protein DFQ29_007705 [Apophysomyces sp. BC1021]KAG0192242.1 hypothetical protein DFQ28_009816 [Apophysomyces sp. BC1034]
MNVFRLKSNSNASAKSPTFVDKELVTQEPILTPPAGYSPVVHPALDVSQQGKVDDLYKYMQSIMLPESHEYHASEKGFLTEATMKRYMRARKWDFEAAKTMLENTLKWRRDYRPDQLDPGYIKPEAETGKMYFNGFDKCGRPVWIMRPRLENSKDAERQVKHIVYSLERGIRLMPEKVENIAIIVDFKDSSASHNPSVATCKKFLDILGNHYPERLAPWFFFATFKIISPFMDPVTKAKIKFAYDNDGKNDTKATTNEWVYLKDHIPENQLETDFGGSYNFSYDVEKYWTALLNRTGNPYKTVEYH